jgi:vanillate O-demethylase monooxygenase subunit
MRDVEAPPTYKAMVPFTGNVDRWQRTTFRPGIILISVGADQPGTNGSPSLSYSANSFQAITPEAQGRTHYFWSTGLDRRSFGPTELEVKVAQVAKTFEEDRVVIEAQYERLMEEPGRPLMGIRSDGPSVMARRILEQLLADEQGRANPAAALGN